MQESQYSLSLQTPIEHLNDHPVLVYISNHSDFFEFAHWKDEVTNMHYARIDYQNEDLKIFVDTTRFFYKFSDLDEHFINEIMYLYNRLRDN